jgi:arylsulfatase
VITDKGGVRDQFTHVIDVVPTILEAVGVRQPSVVDGVPQSPIEGTSLAYTFDKERADEPSQHRTQYFEMMGQYALYHEGWMAVTKVTRPPWVLGGAANLDPANAEWELYDIANDWTQNSDVAAENPEKLRELQDMFWVEAEKYQVLPLDASVATRLVTPRPSITAGRTEFTWNGPLTGTPNGDAPSVLNTSYTITADIEVPEGGGEGMLITQGGRFAGYGFYVLKGKPVFLWNLVGLSQVRWEGADALSAGKHQLEFDFKYDGLGFGTLAFNSPSGIGQGGTGTLKVDGNVVAEQRMEHTIPLIMQWDENLDIGSDTGTPVADADYQVPFTFTGTLEKVTLKLDRPVLTDADKAKLEEAMQKAADQK